MAATSSTLPQTNNSSGANHSAGTSPATDRNSNPNSVGNNPNLNNLLNRGTTMENHNNNSHNSTKQRHHAPTLASMREYCLRWNNHQPNFVSFFTQLLTKESFVDVTLVSSEGRRIQAHKLVLSACSPYFQHVFENNPCKHPIVILKDVQYTDLKTIITFIYNGEVNIAQDRMNSILATASTLQVKGLAEVPADELKRVGGSKGSEHSNNTRHHASASSPWTSGESDSVPTSDVPRKRLKRGNLAGVSSQSTNGDHSASGSFESGVGASVSRSIDEGLTIGQGLETIVSKSPPVTTTRSSLPPLTSASATPKSKSLDTGLDKERRDGGGGPGSADSELSSGGFSENQNFDESSPGAERGYDLEVADVKMDDVEEEEDEGGDLEFEEDDSFGPDDNPDYGDPSYLNMPPSTSAAYFNQPGLHFGASVGSGKGRRGRPLLRQPRIKRQEEVSGRDAEVETLSAPEYALTAGTSTSANSSFDLEIESEEAAAAALAAAAYKEKRFGILRKESEATTTTAGVNTIGIIAKSDETKLLSPQPPQISQQQSIVPILMVSSSSPTPPSSPLQLSIDESEPIPSSVSRLARYDSSAAVSSANTTAKLLSIPTPVGPERLAGSGSITTGQAGHQQPVLVKQVSQPLLPSHTTTGIISSIGTSTPTVQRQHSTPSSLQHSPRILIDQRSIGTINLTPGTANPSSSTVGLKPGTFTYYLPTAHAQQSMGDEPTVSYGESTYIVDTSTGIIQILSPVPERSHEHGGSSGFTRIAHTGNKDMEIFKNESGVSESLGSSMEEAYATGSTGGGASETSTSFSISMEEDPAGELTIPVQRSGHCPVLRPGPALGCNYCWNSVDQCGRILRRKTKYLCPECKINLCIVPCFQEYHERADKKKPKLPKLPKPSSM